jgi:hypothetical protein
MNFPVYSYKPLDEAAQEIRLLTLHSGAFIAPIVVTLLMTSFTKDNIPAFEALLYTWGSPENPVDILINQATDQGTLSITRNLGEALLYLRYEDKPRILWIDAASKLSVWQISTHAQRESWFGSDRKGQIPPLP